MKLTCLLCGDEIVKENNSNEHIIPNAIGGRKTVKGFICKKCNNFYGNKWDADLCRQFDFFCVQLQVKRQRGNHPGMLVSTIDGENLIIRHDGSFVKDKPVFKEQVGDGNVKFHIEARNETEIKKILKGVCRKYPQLDYENLLSHKQHNTVPLDSIVNVNVNFGGENFGRSMVKTALAFAFECGVKLKRSLISCRYLIEDIPVSSAPYHFFYSRDLLSNRDRNRIFHCLAIDGDPDRKTLIAYVEYFSFLRYIVLLDNDYSGEKVKNQYAIDPRTGEELFVDVLIDLSDEELKKVIDEGAGYDGLHSELDHVLSLVVADNHRRGENQAIVDAFDYAKRKLHIKDGDYITEEAWPDFLKHLSFYLANYICAQYKMQRQLNELKINKTE